MKINRIISVAMSLCIAGGCLGSMRAEASDGNFIAGVHGDNITWVLDGEGTLTLTGAGEMKDCEIISGGYGFGQCDLNWIDGSEPPWFSEREKIKKIVIGENITSVGELNFADCDGVTEVVLPSSMNILGEKAFLHCDSLTDINLPEGLEEVSGMSFFYCTAFTELTFPESVKIIGSDAMAYAINLKSVTVKNPDCEIYNDSTTISHDTDINFNGVYDGVICGMTGSTAQAYAEKYGYAFKALDVVPGDVNDDKAVDASDASAVLTAYANLATGNGLGFTEKQIYAADVNNDNAVDASDASSILGYYAYISTGGTGYLEDYIK